jgi:hypothetical protein
VASTNAWTDSFANIQCYDSLKVQAILNEIDGLNHEGTAPNPVPNVFGMNFQAVSVGEKLIENSTNRRAAMRTVLAARPLRCSMKLYSLITRTFLYKKYEAASAANA